MSLRIREKRWEKHRERRAKSEMGVSRNQVAIFKQILPLFSSSYLFALRIKATFMARNLLNNEMRLWINKYTLPKHTHTHSHIEKEREKTRKHAHIHRFIMWNKSLIRRIGPGHVVFFVGERETWNVKWLSGIFTRISFIFSLTTTKEQLNNNNNNKCLVYLSFSSLWLREHWEENKKEKHRKRN